MDARATSTYAGQGKSPHERKILLRVHSMLKKAKAPDARWRQRAKEGVEFYFGRQWKREDKERVERRKQAAIVINRIKPTIRLVHGLVVSQPMDWLAKPAGRNDDEIAKKATAALKFVANANDLKSLEERVYFDALTYGVGWAMVGLRIKDRDRRAEPVQFRRLDPREVRLDPQSQELDITDARYAVWSRRVELGEAAAMYPKFAKQLAGYAGKDEMGGDVPTWDGIVNETPPVSLWKGITEDHDNWNQADKDDDAPDPESKKVTLHELWERYPVVTTVRERKDGTIEEHDPDAPDAFDHEMDPDVVAIYEDTLFKVRYYVFCGGCLIHEADSPYDHDRLPFVPCWCERDEHGDPVSFVESLKDPQREINHRRSKMLFELTANPVRVKPEAAARMGLEGDDLEDHAANPNAIWLGDAGDVEYLNKPSSGQVQWDMYQDAKAEIQATSGANDDLMGYDSSAESGKAKEIQMNQGQMMMRPTEANLRLFHKLLGQLALQLIQQAHTEEWLIRILDEMGQDVFFTLNKRVVDPVTGATRVIDSLDGVRFDIEIEAMPWTPTLRERASRMVAEMANAETDPNLRAALRRIAIQVSDFPEKPKILELLQGGIQQMMAAQVAANPLGDPAMQPGIPAPVPVEDPAAAMAAAEAAMGQGVAGVGVDQQIAPQEVAA